MNRFIVGLMLLLIGCSHADPTTEQQLDAIFMSDTVNAERAVISYMTHPRMLDSINADVIHAYIVDKWAIKVGISDTSDYGALIERSNGRFLLDEAILLEDTKPCIIKFVYWTKYSLVTDEVAIYMYMMCIEHVYKAMEQ